LFTASESSEIIHGYEDLHVRVGEDSIEQAADNPWERWLDREILRAANEASLSRFSQKSFADSRFERA